MSTPGSHQYPSNSGHGAPYGAGRRTSQDQQSDQPFRGQAGTQSTASSSPPITSNLAQSSYGRVTQGRGYDWQDTRSEITSPPTSRTYPGPQDTASHQQVQVPSMHAYTPTGEPYTHHASSTSTQDSSHQFIEQQHSPPRNPRYLHADSQYTSPSYLPGQRGSISPSGQVSLQPQLHPHQPQTQLQSYQSQPHVEWAEQRYPPSHHSSSHAMSPHSQYRDPLPRQYQDASVPYHPTHSTYSQSENRGRQSYQQPRQQLQTSPHRSPAPPYPDFEPASSQPAISQYQSTSPTMAAQPPCHFPRCSLPVIRNNTNELTEYCGEQHMFAAIQQLGIPVCVMCRTLPQRIRVESEYCGAACEWEAWQRLQRQDNERADYQRFTPPSRPVAGRMIYHGDEEPQYEGSESSSSASRRPMSGRSNSGRASGTSHGPDDNQFGAPSQPAVGRSVPRGRSNSGRVSGTSHGFETQPEVAGRGYPSQHNPGDGPFGTPPSKCPRCGLPYLLGPDPGVWEDDTRQGRATLSVPTPYSGCRPRCVCGNSDNIGGSGDITSTSSIQGRSLRFI